MCFTDRMPSVMVSFRKRSTRVLRILYSEMELNSLFPVRSWTLGATFQYDNFERAIGNTW